MPSASARRLYEDQIPPFINPRLVDMEAPKLPTNFPAIHKHNDSSSTQNSGSAESSPTTTASCTDDSSLSDASASTSPESPMDQNLLKPFTRFPSTAIPANPNPPTHKPPSYERPMTSPGPWQAAQGLGTNSRNRRGNRLNLSIVPPSTLGSGQHEVKTKMSVPGLSSAAKDLSSDGLQSSSTLVRPGHPGQLEHLLNRSRSSPALRIAVVPPKPPTTLNAVVEDNSDKSVIPEDNSNKSATREGDGSDIRSQDAKRRESLLRDGEDQKPPEYPDGPIAIYSDNVYLYKAPTAEEAGKFDVVINVAREVGNPFQGMAKSETTSPSVKQRPADDSPIPDTAITTASYATAFEYLPEDDSPVTPRATTFMQPEYIHMPWDHNTDISKELGPLCEKIELRTKEGKKVLVHCLEGKSRSASLIIAYGMWQNPERSLNDTYYAAQAKSRWISPNMTLMYCLQEFQKEVSKKRLAPGLGLKSRPGRSSTKHRMTLSVDAIDIMPKEPLTAPLPGEGAMSESKSPDRSRARARGNSTPNREYPISPGPSSAPASFTWNKKEDDNDLGRLRGLNLEPDSGFAFSNPAARHAPSPFSDSLLSPGFGSFPDLPDSRREPSPFADLPQSPGFGSFPDFLDTRRAPSSFVDPPQSPGFGSFTDLLAPAFPGFAPVVGFAPFSKRPPSPGPSNQGFGGKPRGFNPVPLVDAPSWSLDTDDAALMSPRAETMTNNPLKAPFGNCAGLQFVEVPPTPSESFFSPRESMYPRDPFFPFGRPSSTADPRSPPTRGETPIVRSIDELL